MSEVELLREAAKTMRERESDPTLLAVAELLDEVAANWTPPKQVRYYTPRNANQNCAAAVARAYLGVTA